jgi:hypothetical protein
MSTATQQNEFETSTGILWDDPEAGKTWLVALMGIAILAALVIAISVIYFQTEGNEFEAKVIEPEYVALKDLTARQKDLLDSAGPYTIEVGGQQVTRERIKVSDAMQMVAGNPSLAVPSASAKKPAPAAPAASAPAPATAPGQKK